MKIWLSLLLLLTSCGETKKNQKNDLSTVPPIGKSLPPNEPSIQEPQPQEQRNPEGFNLDWDGLSMKSGSKIDLHSITSF